MARKYLTKFWLNSLCALAVIASLHLPAPASADDLQTLEMFYNKNDLVVSATRSAKPLSQTAESVTVITAADIESMGAHNLLDVLSNVSGFVTGDRGSVGSFGGFSLYGADVFHLVVLVDGVPQNFLGDESIDGVRIPIQNVERIEIIKGPASSAWGSALGGVINVVIKSPAEDRKIGGILSFSAGDRGTRDSRGEASGTIGPFGYYLFAKNLRTGGLSPHTAVDDNALYAKMNWQLPGKGSLLYTISFVKGADESGQVDFYDVAISGRHHYFQSTLAFNYPISDHTDLDLSLRTISRSGGSSVNLISTGELIQDGHFEEFSLGGSAKVNWRKGIHSITFGHDFDYAKVDNDVIDPVYVSISQQHFRTDKWGLFLNDTLTLGDFAITPGIRYDRMRQLGDFTSPSLGIAWSMNDKTVLRAYAARGYSLPVIIPGSTQEKVVSIQAGFETTQVPYLWLKSTMFRNAISDHQRFDASGNPYLTKELKQGVEVEAKTVPLFNTSLSAGCTFIDARDPDTDEILFDVPRQIVKLGLHYNDRSSFRATLLGRFVWFNASPDDNPKDGAVIWDLNLAKKILNFHDTELELFFNGHNIFNGAQYDWEGFQNARRWFEGGVRFNF
jgi:vitamin B12 transporter